ncbi:PssD/Cps14F family polysaccharide biosynthesis glycosyltransferase [Shewanella litorisediminis]|uniref:Polysaccharide biosynthesis protein n=1 Tax=Shewanella litorisediminis TaxID=1173586 RepID=A0ABX7FZN9_9GAMM|nr:PssD/Cps14F family polysaccharide biosynthesis glycosyltransferase [Shewanella litorisediminis]MCL2919635.1 hypothetical protein [Shewanella litorisediminis]QRH00526.1 hypothetical protein JQC75_11585 [Shewanella litorisediminis]
MKNILLCYGNGGHRAQAFRLYNILCPRYSDLRFYTVTDVGSHPEFSLAHLEVGESRDKANGKIQTLPQIIKNIFIIRRFVKKYNVNYIISTGPGVSLLVYLASIFSVKKFIHLETWSKFENITITTRILKLFGCTILYQNEELRMFLPNGIFVGRL